MYTFLRECGFNGLEVAPSRIFPENPYENIAEARQFATKLREKYGLSIPSMQSIWYGRSENIFMSRDERKALVAHTKRAVNFASAIGCGNLVFGCPKNRNIPDGISNPEDVALDFFARISEYAAANGTVIALEPNPPIYGTNFINTTQQAIAFCRKLNIGSFKVNVDVGTMIANEEPVSLIADNIDVVSHIHISEPRLVPIERRKIHREILALRFDGYVSIEMGNCGDLQKVRQTVKYIKGLIQ